MNFDNLNLGMDELNKEAIKKFSNEINTYIEANRDTLFAPLFDNNHPDYLWNIFNVQQITFSAPYYTNPFSKPDYAISIGSKYAYSREAHRYHIVMALQKKYDNATLMRIAESLNHIVDFFEILYKAGFEEIYVNKTGFYFN
jgi:hypothetical protein